MSNVIPLYSTTPNEYRSYGKILRQLGLLSKNPGYFMLGSVRKDFSPPTQLSVGSSMWRVFRCDPTCGVCCKFDMTLDYIPGEVDKGILLRDGFELVPVLVNDKMRPVISQISEASKHGGRCRYVTEYGDLGDRKIGCGRWSTTAPLSCVTAPNIHIRGFGPGRTIIYKGPFGRHTMWSVLPRCEFDPYPVEKIDPEEVIRDIKLFKRWLNWAEYFELDTWLPEIITIFQDVHSGSRKPESIPVI